MFSILYNISISLYSLSIMLVAPFNPKAREWIRGRRNLMQKIRTSIRPNDQLFWFHCASLGEFEQGRPVIEELRKRVPDCRILLTFFSPSGYEVRKDYENADYVFYLPADSRRNARQFADAVQPRAVFFIKYEFWYNYLTVLRKKNIPVYLISAIFRKEQHFFKWYGGWFRKQLQSFEWFFVQNSPSAGLLEDIGLRNITVSGDTRFDRVSGIAAAPKEFPPVMKFIGSDPVLIAGSTWPADEEVILPLPADHNLKFIIAPHETGMERITELRKKIRQPVILFSEMDNNEDAHASVLIIDNIGILSHLYRYATIVYIGGGFGRGIHNILEAVTFGKPVIFGPNYHKFQEATDLIRLGGAFSIKNEKEFMHTVNLLLTNVNEYNRCSDVCLKFISERTGATQKILDHAFNQIIQHKDQ